VDDPPTENVVAGATDDRADPERQGLSDQARAAGGRELPDEGGLQPVGERPHDGPGEAGRHEFPPIRGARGTVSGKLAGELAHQV